MTWHDSSVTHLQVRVCLFHVEQLPRCRGGPCETLPNRDVNHRPLRQRAVQLRVPFVENEERGALRVEQLVRPRQDGLR